MKQVTFITGNQKKADYLAQYFGAPIEHIKLELDEIQSLDLKEVVRHKVRQAYEQVKKPVLVEDVSLEFTALGRLPGTYIKWFLEELSSQQLADLVNGKDRSAVGRSMFGYFDGQEEYYVVGELRGQIATTASNGNGFGWDSIFIPEGYSVTRAELNSEDYEKVYRQVRPFVELKKFLEA